MARIATVERNTKETQIKLTLNLDGSGKYSVKNPIGFFNHMLTLLAAHGRFDLNIRCAGDTQVDYHHTVEDVGIALGDAFRQALGDKRGICRYGSTLLPMDEALVLTAVDFSGRCFLGWQVPLPTQKVGDFDTELGEEFWYGFARQAQCSLHVRLLTGTNSHHIVEGAFKSVGRALKAAVALDGSNEIPSTKGVL